MSTTPSTTLSTGQNAVLVVRHNENAQKVIDTEVEQKWYGLREPKNGFITIPQHGDALVKFDWENPPDTVLLLLFGTEYVLRIGSDGSCFLPLACSYMTSCVLKIPRGATAPTRALFVFYGDRANSTSKPWVIKQPGCTPIAFHKGVAYPSQEQYRELDKHPDVLRTIVETKDLA